MLTPCNYIPDGTAQLLMCSRPAGDTCTSTHAIIVFVFFAFYLFKLYYPLSFLDVLLSVLPICVLLFDQQYSCLPMLLPPCSSVFGLYQLLREPSGPLPAECFYLSVCCSVLSRECTIGLGWCKKF